MSKDNTHTHTRIYTYRDTVVRARFLKTKNTYTQKRERKKNSGEIKY